MADGNDDVLLFLNPGGPGHTGSAWTVRQRGLGHGGEMVCASHSGCMALNERAGTTSFHQASSRCLLLAFPRERLLPQLADVDRALRQNLADTLPLRLLTRQALALTRPPVHASDTADTSDAERLRISDQLLDLSALALGATPQAQARASARGLRQARLKAIQADLRIHAGRGDLSLDWVAARHGISPGTCGRCSSGRTSPSATTCWSCACNALSISLPAPGTPGAPSAPLRTTPVSTTSPGSTGPSGSALPPRPAMCGICTRSNSAYKP